MSPINLKKTEIFYKGYLRSGTSHVCHTIYSLFDRYPQQIKLISEKMRIKPPLKMLCIGVAEGQEPLTYLNQACKIGQQTNKPVHEILDLTLVEAAEKIPLCSKSAKEHGISSEAIQYLEDFTDSRTISDKVHYATPFEKFDTKGSKYDVILFNNVVQHVNYVASGEEKIFGQIEHLLNSLTPNGIFCFKCEAHVLEKNSSIRTKYNKVIDILTQKGFQESEKGSGVYKRLIKLKN